MVAQQINSTQRKRIKLMFVLLMLVLPAQFYVVYNYANIYPCVHMPGFRPVLDDHEGNLFYADTKLYFVTADGKDVPVLYTELFDQLPEFFARHTMKRLFKYNAPNEAIQVDDITAQWLKDRSVAITGAHDITALKLVTTDYRYRKEEPKDPKLTTTSVNLIPLP